MSSPLLQALTRESINAGFPVSGGVDIEKAMPFFSGHLNKYQDWISRGLHGEMGYLERGLQRREDPRNLMPSAKSLFAVMAPYSSVPLGTTDSKLGVQYARYIRGLDYHDEIPERLSKLIANVMSETGLSFEYKICVDTSALLERSWASFCGLGWIGKNTMLIHPQFGSYFLLGFVLLSKDLDAEPKFLKDYCGSCEKCLSACPTNAFNKSHELDSRKCISYQTLEKRGEITFSNSQKSQIGNRVAGCDICQEVCPFNLKKMKSDLEREPSAQSQTYTFEELAVETQDLYKERVRGSALNRVKPEMFQRNLKICFENSKS